MVIVAKVRTMTMLEHQSYEIKRNNISVSKEYTDSLLDEEEALELAEEQAKAYQEAIAGFSDIQSAYDTLKSASDEYNETGTYSLKPYQNY